MRGLFCEPSTLVSERVEVFDDPLAELLRRGVEVRFVSNLLRRGFVQERRMHWQASR